MIIGPIIELELPKHNDVLPEESSISMKSWLLKNPFFASKTHVLLPPFLTPPQVGQEIFYPSSSAILLQSLLLNFLTMLSSVSKPPSADVVCESSPINLLSPAGHSPSLLSAVPFQLLSEGVTMSLDISTEGQSVPLHGSSVLFHVLNFLTEGSMCL